MTGPAPRMVVYPVLFQAIADEIRGGSESARVLGEDFGEAFKGRPVRINLAVPGFGAGPVEVVPAIRPAQLGDRPGVTIEIVGDPAQACEVLVHLLRMPAVIAALDARGASSPSSRD